MEYSWNFLPLSELFTVKAGDYHAKNELDEKLDGVPLISCGDTDNGFIGYYDVPEDKTYQNAITVAFNGQPMTAKFHPYRFAAKDDVGVLIPKQQVSEKWLIVMAAVFNEMRWRFSYGRKCFKTKMLHQLIPAPVVLTDKGWEPDEALVQQIFPQTWKEYVPAKPQLQLAPPVPIIGRWKQFPITKMFNVRVGDFHSMQALDEGQVITISRVSGASGFAGYYEAPEGATVFPAGTMTVSTLGGEAFVQPERFIATDNVLILEPIEEMPLTTVVFVAIMLNAQSWRYSYGRQCYQAKFGKTSIQLPIGPDNKPDVATMDAIVRQSSFWKEVETKFGDQRSVRPAEVANGKSEEFIKFEELTRKLLQVPKAEVDALVAAGKGKK